MPWISDQGLILLQNGRRDLSAGVVRIASSLHTTNVQREEIMTMLVTIVTKEVAIQRLHTIDPLILGLILLKRFSRHIKDSASDSIPHFLLTEQSIEIPAKIFGDLDILCYAS